MLYIDTKIKNTGFGLIVSGELYGEVFGVNAEDVCNKLVEVLYKHTDIDKIYVDLRGYGVAVAEILSQYTHVVGIKPIPLEKPNERGIHHEVL